MWKLAADRNVKGMGLSKVLASALSDLMDANPDLVYLEADLAGAAGSDLIQNSHPDRFIQCGIAEANMAGAASGMSLLGYHPFIHSFGPFASRRLFDQIYASGGYQEADITVFASDPGFCAGPNGGTHTTFEDMALYRTIPGSIVADAADQAQMEWLVKELASRPGIHLLRANRKPVRHIYEKGSTFELGKGNVLKEGRDILILSCGQLVSDALDAAEELEQEGISCQVMDLITVKPLDESGILSALSNKKVLVTFENHGRMGGLGSAVSELLADKGIAIPFVRLGAQEQFGQVGTQDWLQALYGLDKETLRTTIRNLYERQD